MERREESGRHLAIEAVEDVGAIQRQGEDTVTLVDQKRGSR
jgi:hypothetical protein